MMKNQTFTNFTKNIIKLVKLEMLTNSFNLSEQFKHSVLLVFLIIMFIGLIIYRIRIKNIAIAIS